MRRLSETTAWLRERWRVGYGGRMGRELLCLPVGCVIALLGSSVLPLLGAVVATPVVGRWLRSRRRERDRVRRAAGVIDLCATVSGRAAGRAASRRGAAGGGPGAPGGAWGLVTAAARFGGEVPDALPEGGPAAGCRGADRGRGLLAGGGGRGSGAGGGSRPGGGGAARRAGPAGEPGRQVGGGQGPRRGTGGAARSVGLVLGGLLGSNPLHELLHTPTGLSCLLVGGLLEWAGLVDRRMVRAAREPGRPVADER
ncbi:Membrane protein OS=Streptomyces antimycoticus OX=68175 GN=SSPO_053880 PE=4 SV=1 [Streptomyces antimycoticus]